MPKTTASLELDLPPDRALAVCRNAIASIEWELVEGDADLSGRQDPARLCCESSPVTVDIALAEAGEGRTAVSLCGHVLGWGPVAARDLRNGMHRVAVAIGRTSVGPG